MTRYTQKSKIKEIKIEQNGKKEVFFVEIIKEPNKALDPEFKEKLIKDLHKLIDENWGDFGAEFLKIHLLPVYLMAIVTDNEGMVVGLASISKKMILKREIFYFEFTVIEKSLESKRLATIINSILIRKIIINLALRLRFRLEFFLLTPNMKVLGILSRLADFIYPDPYKYDLIKQQIDKADNETWIMANEIIKNSDNPNRKILRDGLVVVGSYDNTPWLKYNTRSAPKYRDEIVNKFGEKYLNYKEGSGNEFLVRLKVNFFRAIYLSIKEGI